MHEGEWSSRLGVPGIPAAAEEMMVARDIALVRLTGGRVHFLHLSTADRPRWWRRPRPRAWPSRPRWRRTTCRLTHAELAGYDPVYKVNPPLRAAADVSALRAAAHAASSTPSPPTTPRTPPEPRRRHLDAAPPGMLGLETALAVALDALGATGLRRAAGRRATTRGRATGDVGARPGLSWRPARIAGLARDQGGDQGGPIGRGLPANLCVIDPDATWEVDPHRLASRSRNTPWAGRILTGQVRHTVFRGEPVVLDTVAQR